MLQNATQDLPGLTDRIFPAVADLVLSRHRLRGYFDAWIEGVDDLLPVSSFLHAMALGLDAMEQAGQAVDPADDTQALALSMASLAEPRRIVSFFAAASEAGLFDSVSAQTDLELAQQERESNIAKLMELLEVDPLADILSSGFQAHGGAGGNGHEAFGQDTIWMQPGVLLPAVTLARRRLCKIEVVDPFGGVSRGTGFLIGPSAVLTCRHVVEKAPDLLPKRGAGELVIDPSAITCTFDFSQTSGTPSATATKVSAASDWRMADSPTGDDRPLDAAPKWWDDANTLIAWLTSVAQKLDYAVIRLDAAPGLQRGWYDLADLAAKPYHHAMTLHHPGGAIQTISFGPTQGHAQQPRVFHKSATTKGSSGGLVLNEEGQPIGLHQSGESFQEHVSTAGGAAQSRLAFMNVAVPLHLIAADLASKSLDGQPTLDAIRVTAKLVPPRGCLTDNHPLFGRKSLLAKLEQMLAPDGPRILMVHLDKDVPIRKPGMSFTMEIVKALLPASEHHHIVFRAGDTKADAEDMARKMVRTVSPELESRLPQHPDTTMAAYAQTLASFFDTGIKSVLTNRTVWVMIDDLDKHNVADGSGREFLSNIYSRTQEMSQLRVILIGLPAGIEISGLPENVIKSTIRKADLTKLDQQFTDWFQERIGRDLPFEPQSLDFIAQTVLQYAGDATPLSNMAQFVTNNIDPVAERILAAQKNAGDGT